MGQNASNSMTFNIDQGYLEGLIRGFKGGILKRNDYMNLTQCETLDDLKLHLQSTDYGNFMANEAGPLTVQLIEERLRDKLVAEFKMLRNNAVEPFATFLDFMTYGYMIDNIILLITGLLHQRSMEDLIVRCHPLGRFEGLEAISVANTPADLYNHVIVDTPLAPYFTECISEQDLNEMNIEIIRNTLYKAYLEDFAKFCEKLGGPTAEVMREIIAFEADRRAIMITLNSFGTELTKDDRSRLYPRCGKLYPEGLAGLERAEDAEQVRQVADYYAEYRQLFENVGEGTGEKTLEDRMSEHEVGLNVLAFMQQYNLGVAYAYLKLKEQEIRNIVWIAECIAQKHRAKIENYITIFD